MAYKAYCESVKSYITYRINDADEAADIAQDVFLKLMEHYDMLRADTMKNLIYTLVNNKINDFLRRHYKKNEVYAHLYECQPRRDDTLEAHVVARNIQEMELKIVSRMPRQRKRIYTMLRFEDKRTDDVAETLNISRRTVEAHRYLAQYEVRRSLLKII